MRSKGGFRCVHEDNFVHCNPDDISEVEERGVTHCIKCNDDTYPSTDNIYFNNEEEYKHAMRLVELREDERDSEEDDLTKWYTNSSTGVIGKYYNKCEIVNSNQGTEENFSTPDNLQFC